MLPISLKGALVLTLGFAGGMLDVQCPETWLEATEHLTCRWRPLSPKTPLAEIVQRSPEGAGKEPHGPGRNTLRTSSLRR